MTRQEFFDEMGKLRNRFDPKYYPHEVLDLIFIETEDLGLLWLKKAVAMFLGQHKPALIPEFRDAARMERERQKLNQAIRPFRHDKPSIFSDEEKNQMFAVIQGALSKKLSRKEVAQYEELVWRSILERVRCRLCLDEGYVHAMPRDHLSTSYIFLCQCDAGRRCPENYPKWHMGLLNKFRIINNGPEKPDGAA